MQKRRVIPAQEYGNVYLGLDAVYNHSTILPAITINGIKMFVELIYDKRNFEGLAGAKEIILNELTKRVHRIFPMPTSALSR